MTGSKPLTFYLTRGAILGALTGFGVSTAYTGLLIAFFLVMMLWGVITTAPTHPADSAMMLFVGPAIAGFMFICASFIGVVPGTILGLAIGVLISLPLGLFQAYLSPVGAAVVGTLVSAIAVVLIHFFLFSSDSDLMLRDYLLVTILPGLLCIAAGGWVGWKLHQS